MTLLTIRASRRYATRQPASVTGPGDASCTALLIELSTEGCRFSTTDALAVKRGDELTVKIRGRSLKGCVRWGDSQTIGLRFDKALFQPELREILAAGADAELAKAPVQTPARQTRLAASC